MARKSKTPAAPKKRKPTAAELANDPSLRWCPYRPWELVNSDAHPGAPVRFLRYVGGDRVELATLHGIAPLAGTFPALSVRRP